MDVIELSEVTCEEIYGEDWRELFAEVREFEVQEELDLLADAAREVQVDWDWEQLIGMQFLPSSILEASHVAP